MKKFLFWLKCARAYSLPMSFIAWLVPFVFGMVNGGNILHGVIAYMGIASAHMGGNLFDDYLDYKRFVKNNNTTSLQKGKCSYLFENQASVKDLLVALSMFFGVALIIGAFFMYTYKLPILVITAITGILCLIYPRSSYYGFGEFIIGAIFAPLLFCGVYYVMTGMYSTRLMLLSIPFGIVTISLLYVHSFMDFHYDRADEKRTLCTIVKSKENAYSLLLYMFFAAYFYIFALVSIKILPVVYLFPCLTIFHTKNLCSTVKSYIDKDPQNEKEFLSVFSKAQNQPVIFALFLIFSILFDYLF